MKKIIIILALLIQSTYAVTTLSGKIASDTTISGDVRITDTLSVKYNTTLTILAGTTIEVDSACLILVNGTIKAIGTKSDSIKFIRSRNDDSSYWAGFDLSVVFASQDSSIFEYCVIEGAKKENEGGAFEISRTNQVRLSHSSIRNNMAVSETNSSYYPHGGAMSLYQSNIIIDNCSFVNNKAITSLSESYGGALYMNDSHPIITNSIFEGNICQTTAARSATGGALYLYRSNPLVRKCIITENSVISLESESKGGALYLVQSNPVIDSCDISHNVALGLSSASGAGIGLYDSEPIITDCIFKGNQVKTPDGIFSSSGASGAAIKSSSSSPIIKRVKFIENKTISHGSASGGAIYFSSSDSSRLEDCEIIGNECHTTGGSALGAGIILNTSYVIIKNCNIDSNIASGSNGYSLSGGGMYTTGSTLSIKHCSFVANKVISDDCNEASGGGVYLGGSKGVIDSCLFTNDSAIAQSSDARGGAIGIFGGAVTISNCTINSNSSFANDGNTNGSALYITNGSATFLNCKITENRSVAKQGSTQGSISYMYKSATIFQNCKIYENSAIATDDALGGFYLFTSSSQLINSKVFNNTLSSPNDSLGTAIYFRENQSDGGQTLLVKNTLLQGDSYIISPSDGIFTIEMINVTYPGGLKYKVYSDVDSLRLNLTNTIFRGEIIGVDGTGNLKLTATYSNINGGDAVNNSRVGNIDLDPIFVDPQNFDFTLMQMSPSINSGTPDTTGLFLSLFDVDSNLRITESIIDMGAYEVGVSTAIVSFDQISNEKIKIFPNPVVDRVNVVTELFGEILIYNSQGKFVYSPSSNKFSLKHLTSGTYFCVISHKGKVQAVKSFYKK